MTQKIFLFNLGELKENTTLKFSIPSPSGKFSREGFVLFHRGEYRAYYNECAHISIPLDWEDNDFFSLDLTKLVCKNHGAEFLPESGLCTAGPCTGATLKPISLEMSDDKVFAVL